MEERVMRNGWMGLLLPLCIVLVGCDDKAAPKLAECKDAKAKGDAKAAISACEYAAGLAPLSKAGRQARALADAWKAEALAADEARRKENDAHKELEDGKPKDGKPKGVKPCKCLPADPLCEC